MEFLIIELKPLEPLMLRGPGEFDPSSRGVYSYAYSLILPRPSTMVGMLISMLLYGGSVGGCLDVSSWMNLIKKCYAEIFDELGIEALRGPYIIRDNHLYVPIMLGRRIRLLEYSQAKRLLLGNREYEGVLEELLTMKRPAEVAAVLRLMERDLRGDKVLRKYVIEPESISFTGIHLKSRKYGEGGKIVEEGYIYTANYTSYPLDTEISFLLAVKDPSKTLSRLRDKKVVKFGGEGRAAKMSIKRLDESSVVYNALLKAEEARYAILSSPMPLIGNHLNTPFIGEYTIIGYGFSIAKRRRKPLSPSISEGSVLRIDASRGRLDREEVLRYGLYSVLGLTDRDEYYKHIGRLGYASFIPLA